jgi:hypothetical protein
MKQSQSEALVEKFRREAQRDPEKFARKAAAFANLGVLSLGVVALFGVLLVLSAFG